jgi:hypothetical protein
MKGKRTLSHWMMSGKIKQKWTFLLHVTRVIKMINFITISILDFWVTSHNVIDQSMIINFEYNSHIRTSRYLIIHSQQTNLNFIFLIQNKCVQYKLTKIKLDIWFSVYKYTQTHSKFIWYMLLAYNKYISSSTLSYFIYLSYFV